MYLAQEFFDLVLDGNITGVRLNDTFRNEATPIYHAENMTDGDHELVGEVNSLTINGSFRISHFECGALAPLCPKYSVLTISPLPELKIRLEAASTFSVPDQLRRTFPRRRSLWTILTRRLYTTTNPCGFIVLMLVPEVLVTTVLVTTEEACPIQILLVLR